MPLSDIAVISITSDTPGVTAAGFGTPLVLAADATFTERVRTYTDLTGLVADFATTTATYKQVSALFSQNPRPVSVKVGRLANKPTQSWTIDLGSAGILASTKYQIQVLGPTGGVQQAVYTTDGSPTETELWGNLATNFNALTGPTVTATNAGPNTSLTLIADVAGTWHGIACLTPDSQYDAGVYLSVISDEADPGIAADLAAIASADNAWYAILCPFTSEAITDVIAIYAEANEKIFLADVQDSATVTAAVGGTDTTDDLKDAAYARTAPIYHPDNTAFAAAAWAGRVLPLDPGSETWMFKTLAGVPVYPITGTHQTNLEAKNCNYYYDIGGVHITKDGKVSSGSFIDFIRFRDWFKARLAERIFNRLASSSKIAYTDAGIAILEAEVRAQIKEGIAVGGISPDPAPTVTAPRARDASTADRSARLLRNLKFTFTYAGAIHKVLVSGNISL
jgi:hypothetical protein